MGFACFLFCCDCDQPLFSFEESGIVSLAGVGFLFVRTEQTLCFVWGDPVFAMLASRELQGSESGFLQSVAKGHALGFLQNENRKREDLVFWEVRRGVMEGDRRTRLFI